MNDIRNASTPIDINHYSNGIDGAELNSLHSTSSNTFRINYTIMINERTGGPTDGRTKEAMKLNDMT